MCVLVIQLCLTLCNPTDDTHEAPLSVHGILQARILGGIAIPFSRGSSRPRDRTQVSCIAGDQNPLQLALLFCTQLSIFHKFPWEEGAGELIHFQAFPKCEPKEHFWVCVCVCYRGE